MLIVLFFIALSSLIIFSYKWLVIISELVIEPTLFKLEPVTCEFIYRNDKGILVSNLAKESNIKLAIDMDYAGFKNLYYGLLSVSKTKDE